MVKYESSHKIILPYFSFPSIWVFYKNFKFLTPLDLRTNNFSYLFVLCTLPPRESIDGL